MGGSIYTSGYIGFQNNSRNLQFDDVDGLVRLQSFYGIRLMSYDTTAYTDVVRIDGNVTTRTVQVSGSLRVSGSSRLLGSIDMTGPGVDGDGSDRFIYGGRTNQTASIQLFNPQTGRVHINPWNNSGVTITGSLDVSGNLTFNGSIALGNDQAITNPAGAFYKLYDGATGNSIIRGATSSDGLSRIRLQTGTSATDRFVVFGTGNITIGPNTDLGSRLGIRGSGATSATTALRVENTNASASLVVLDNGFVGINTGSAQYNLDVNGTARVTGAGSTSSTTAFIIRNSLGNTLLSVKDGGSDKVVTIASALVGIMDMAGNTIQVGSGNSIRFIAPNGCAFNTTYASPDSSAQVDVASTTKGFLPPRMTNAQRVAISTPAVGLMVYCTDATEGLYIYKSTGWTFIV
jgi:hypothetical protein